MVGGPVDYFQITQRKKNTWSPNVYYLLVVVLVLPLVIQNSVIISKSDSVFFVIHCFNTPGKNKDI